MAASRSLRMEMRKEMGMMKETKQKGSYMKKPAKKAKKAVKKAK